MKKGIWFYIGIFSLVWLLLVVGVVLGYFYASSQIHIRSDLKNANDNIAQKTQNKHLISSLKDQIQKLNEDKSGLLDQLKNADDRIDFIKASKEKDCAQIIDEIKSSLSADKGNLDKLVKDLKAQILEDNSTINKLRDEKQSLLLKIDEQKESISKELEKNEKKHSKNYILLNEKIIALELKKNDLEDKISEQTNSYKNNLLLQQKLELANKQNNDYKKLLSHGDKKILSLKKDISKMEKENKLLSEEIRNVKESNLKLQEKYGFEAQKVISLNNTISQDENYINKINNDKKILSLKLEKVLAQNNNLQNEINLLTLENKKLQDNASRSTIKLKEKLNLALAEIRDKQAKIVFFSKDLQTLSDKNDFLSNQIILLKSMTDKKTTKPMMISSIKCDDMQMGTNEPTPKCKKRVFEFLNKYNDSYFFEVIPIVDNGGFASLNMVKNSNIGIPEDEIKRLTRLSNIGIGKDRARIGGELIRDKFGDMARISYGVSNIDIPNKRGFVIRVYE